MGGEMQRRREEKKKISKGDNVPEWIMDGYGDAKKQLSAATGSSQSEV